MSASGIKSNFFIGKVGKFVIVGGVSTAFNYMVFYLLLKFLHTNYLLASAGGYAAGVALGFFMNNFWTFGSSNLATSKIAGYCIVYLISLGISSLFLWITVHQFQFNPMYMNVLGICISTTTNFIGLNYIIYRK